MNAIRASLPSDEPIVPDQTRIRLAHTAPPTIFQINKTAGRLRRPRANCPAVAAGDRQPFGNRGSGKVTPDRKKVPIMLFVFELSAALALGFFLGRIWQMRQEMRQNGF